MYCTVSLILLYWPKLYMYLWISLYSTYSVQFYYDKCTACVLLQILELTEMKKRLKYKIVFVFVYFYVLGR